MADEQAPNGFQQAANEMSEYMDKYHSVATTGGKIAAEEQEKAETQAVAPPPDDPAPTAGSTPENTQPPAEQPADDPWQKLAEGAGKWKDAEEAKKGYFHALNLAKNALKERDELQARLSSNSGQMYANGVQPQVPSQEIDPVKALEDYGVPADVFARAVDQRAQQTLAAILAPMATQFQVDQQLGSEHPEWTANRAEIGMFLDSQPALKAQYEAVKRMGTPEAVRTAEEFAFYKFRDSRAGAAEVALKANNEVRKELVEQARKDAGIIGAKRSDGVASDSNPKKELTHERFESLKEKARAGYSNQLWRETIGAGLPDELFNV